MQTTRKKFVKLLIRYESREACFDPGSVVAFDEAKALRMIAEGHAETATRLMIAAPGKLWVRLSIIILRGNETYYPGTEVQLDEAHALDLIKKGHAERISPEKYALCFEGGKS